MHGDIITIAVVDGRGTDVKSSYAVAVPLVDAVTFGAKTYIVYGL